MSKVGYKKPPVETQFGQPNGNPTGKTAKQRDAEIANAEKATLIRGRLLDAVMVATEAGASLDHIEASILKLVKDAEDRGLGTAVQSVNVESPNGTMTPSATVSLDNLTEADLDQLERLTDKARDTGGTGKA
jgi:hypothetical protein